ncbi:MAG: hypothetical protein ACT4QE_18775 [Anaerolineales bacterium]
MATVTLTLTDDQLLELIAQLPPDRQRSVLERLKADSDAWWAATQREGEAQLRRFADERGLRWDTLSEAERLVLVDDLVHEARAEKRR